MTNRIDARPQEIADLETAITKEKDAITQKTAEIDTLGDSIRALDKSVAEATEQCHLDDIRFPQ